MNEGRGPERDAADAGQGTVAPEEPPEGFVRLRGALLGLGLLWLAAIAAFGALQATIYGLTTSPPYLAVAAGTVTLSAASGYASLRAFGLR